MRSPSRLSNLDQHLLPVKRFKRLTKRLGWIRPQASAEEAHRVLEAAVPDECKLDLHVNLIAHGRTICRAQGNGGPRCDECILLSCCAYGKSIGAKAAKVTAPRKAEGSTSTSPTADFFVTIDPRPQRD